MAEPGGGPPPAPGTEGLPRAFLQSLRTLFDILDDRRRGLVHLREIESRWRGADARELPRGVLEGLRQVAPASGYLTFERFVAGLRTALPSADGDTRAPARAPARGGCSARPGGQPPPPRLVFAPADEPRTVLERKPLPLGARPPPAGPGVASRNLEKPCGLAEAAPGPAEPERPHGAALERSPSKDTGEWGRPLGPPGAPRGRVNLGHPAAWRKRSSSAPRVLGDPAKELVGAPAGGSTRSPLQAKPERGAFSA